MRDHPPGPIRDLEEKIARNRLELHKLQNRRTFPFVYIVVAVPITVLFVVLAMISQGFLDMTTAVTGSLFFSLLITCSYIVLFQPNRDEMVRDLTYRINQQTREKARLESGLRGEQEVAYHLRWLPEGYLVFHNIIIETPRLGHQQIDHLVVGPNGVFHLETKNMNGMLVISERGDWTMVRSTKEGLHRQGIDSPHNQIERHEQVIKDILKTALPHVAVPLNSVVVMAHPKTIIEGKDPSLEVLKKDKLITYIQHWSSGNPLSPKMVQDIARAFVRATVIDDQQ
ncbi:MAG: nuclease-related domain-containing protein [Bacillota bacterium]